MPPKRNTRANSSRLFDGSSEAGGPLESESPLRGNTGVRGMSPGPAKYSSTYGSPATLAPTRQNVSRQRYNFTSALSHVLDAVEMDNEDDAHQRAVREAGERGLDTRELERAQEDTRRRREQQEAEKREKEEAEEAARQQRERETSTSVDLVQEPATRRRTKKKQTRTAPQAEATPPPRPPAAAAPAEAAPAQAAPAANPFAEADNVFAEAEIFTPVVPARPSADASGTGILSKTSNILHNLLNSARRTRNHEEAEEEAVRQAYPHLKFINPPQDNRNAGEQSSADAANSQIEGEAAVQAAMAPAAGRKTVGNRQATPGPSARTRRGQRNDPDQSLDELAGRGDEASAAPGRNTRRRQAQNQAGAVAAQEPAQPSPPPPAPASAAAPAAQVVAPKPGFWGCVLEFGELTKAFAMAITILTLSLITIRACVITTASPELYEGYRIDNRLHWYGSDWRSNLRQLVPFAFLHPIGALSDEEFARVNGLILGHANEIAQLRHADRLHGDAVEQINQILPAVVHMKLDKRGRPVISQDFWHALKDLVMADRDIFTLIKKKDGSMTISDVQWTALKNRLEASGMLPDSDTKALTVRDVEGIAQTTMSKSWEAWLRRNQKKVKDILGVVPPPPPSSSSSSPSSGADIEHLTDTQLAKLARQMANSERAKEVIVSKQEFLQHLQNSFVEHRIDIKGELADLEARVVETARTAAEALAAAAARPAESPSAGSSGGGSATDDNSSNYNSNNMMSKKEIMQLVDQYFRKYVRDTQLEAMAKGTIRSNWNSELVHNVNFFSRNTGAIFNHHFSSPAYTPASYYASTSIFWSRGSKSRANKLRAKKANKKPTAADIVSSREAGSGDDTGKSDTKHAEGSNRPAPGSMRGSVAFEKWEEDGDCWCAAAEISPQNPTKRLPADLAVKLGVPIVPEHLVVEHISLSATLDPGAMPKDIELWAQISDYKQQKILQDWSLTQFKESTDAGDPLFGWGFVKLGEFEFSPSNHGSGADSLQVFRLPPELGAMDAITDHVLVRALTNHGDKDHTCFYRVRLYGEPQLD